jgi:hypothetical protein
VGVIGGSIAGCAAAIGADGYASAIRERITPGSLPHVPGYGLWRGTYPEDLMPDGAAAAGYRSRAHPARTS